MSNIIDIIKTVFAVIGGFIGAFLGGVDGLIIALLVFIAVDYITGVIIAIINKKLSSEVGFKGIAKKVFILFLVGVGNLIDIQILKSGAVFRTAVIFFYLSNEGISILENMGSIGLPIPQKLKDILAQLNKDKE